MAIIVSINAFRRGAGCSNVLASLAVLLAAAGQRVGLVDTNIQSPALHLLFGLKEAEMNVTLYDFLLEQRHNLDQLVHRVTLPASAGSSGSVHLLPASTKAEQFRQILSRGYDVNLLSAGLEQLADGLALDILLIDTQPGMNEETMVSIAISDVLLILLRTDQRDYQGTAMTVQVAHELKVPRLMLIVNEAPALFDQASIKAEVARTYDCEVAAVLPYSNKLMALAGTNVFALQYPDHPLTTALEQVAAGLLA